MLRSGAHHSEVPGSNHNCSQHLANSGRIFGAYNFSCILFVNVIVKCSKGSKRKSPQSDLTLSDVIAVASKELHLYEDGVRAVPKRIVLTGPRARRVPDLLESQLRRDPRRRQVGEGQDGVTLIFGLVAASATTASTAATTTTW